MLVVSSGLIFSLMRSSMDFIMKYPVVECSSVFEVYGESDNEKMKYAYLEDQM